MEILEEVNNTLDNKSKDKAIFKGSNYRITVLSELLLRLEFDLNGSFEDRPTELAAFRNFEVPEFEVQEDDKYLDIKTKYLHLQYTKEKPFIGPKYAPDSYLKVSLINTDKLWWFNHPEARNFKGTNTSLDNSNGKTTYKKGLYSTDGFASIDDGSSMIIDENGMLIQNTNPRIDTYLFVYRRDFGYCLRDYFKLTGRPPLIPRYSLGIWWNKTENYSFNELKNLIKVFNREKIPVSVLLLGETWHLKDEKDLSKFKTGFTFNQKLLPNPPENIKYLHERGIRVGINIDPVEGIMPHEKHYNDFCSELNVTEKVTIPFSVFDHKIIKSYLKKLIKPLSDIGVDFFWIDHRHNFETLRALNYYHFNQHNTTQRGLILSRNGLIAAHKYPVHYSGETIVDWKTLELLPFYNSTSSNIGISWWSHDIGGYKEGIEDSDLYTRYVQLGTYSPIFRFSSRAGRYYKREPWAWDIKTYSIVRDYCNLRHRLIPYLYTEAYKYSKTGMPIVQPIYYQYPEIYDEPLYKNQYYFGSELFIAPITTKKDTVMNRAIQRLYLPKGVWYDFKTGKKFNGDKRYVTFVKDEDYPVFARTGSIIPLADLEENINVTNPPKSMEIHVFPGKSNVYNLYEDDGYSSLYKEGYFINTRIEYNYLENNYTVIIRPMEGKTGIIPDLRDYRIRFRNVKESDDVKAFVENNPIPLKSYEDGTDFVVEVQDAPTTKQLTINCKGNDIEIDAVRIINDDIDSIISELQIKTSLKLEIAEIMFSDKETKRKRIEIRKLKKKGLDPLFVRMFIKLLEYIALV